nr:transposase (putative), gypsy type [Tanacetum cinerariifolium]
MFHHVLDYMMITRLVVKEECARTGSKTTTTQLIEYPSNRCKFAKELIQSLHNIDAEAASRQLLVAAEAKIVDLRQKIKRSIRLSNALKSKHEENEAYLSEIENYDSCVILYNFVSNILTGRKREEAEAQLDVVAEEVTHAKMATDFSWCELHHDQDKAFTYFERLVKAAQADREWERQTIVSFCQAARPRGRQDLLNPGLAACVCFPFLPTFFTSCLTTFPLDPFTMSLEESDDLSVLDAEPVSLVLEVGSLSKFDMHPYKSSLIETQVKWLAKCYGISDDLHPLMASKGMTMNALPNDAISLYAHHFYKGAKSCKVAAGDLLPLGLARMTHLSSQAERLEDLPPKTLDMETAEIPCRKVLDDKETKKRTANEKAATNAPVDNIQAERVAENKDVGKEGARKKRRVRVGTPAQPVSKHVSSLTPLNHAKPLETLASEEYVSPNVSIGRIGPLLETVKKLVCGEVAPEVEANNFRQCQDMMSNLFTPANNEFFNEGVRNDSAVKRSWKMLYQSTQQQANVLLCFKALMEEHADLVYAHESCKDVKVRYKECKKELTEAQSSYDEKASAYDQLSKNYEGDLTRVKTLLDRLEELEDEKKEAKQLSSKQTDRINQLEEALKQSKADAYQLRLEKERHVVEVGNREMVRRRIINQYLLTFVRRLHQSAEYKRSLGEAFSLAIGKGFIDGIYIDRKDSNIQAILKATPNVNPASADAFCLSIAKFIFV